MRIGIFTDTYPPYINGVSTSVKMLEQALKEKGHQVYIVTVNTKNMKYIYENDGKTIRIPGIPTGIYDYRLTGIYPVRVINKIKKWNLDVIHSHTEFGVGTFARIISKQFGIPLVHTYHTMYEDYVHYITHGYFDKSSKKLVEYFTKFYCDKTASELIVPSKKTYNLFKEKYKCDKNIYIVPTGMDIDNFDVNKLKQSKIQELKDKYELNNSFVILYVGRLAEEKNIEFILGDAKDLNLQKNSVDIIVVDFHAEATAEKIALYNYLDGEANIIFGTHTHVQTADEEISELGTGFISDLGMTGPKKSVIGMDVKTSIKRFETSLPEKYKIAEGKAKINGCIFELDDKTNKVVKITRVNK